MAFQAPKTLRSKGDMANFEAKNTIKRGKTLKGQMVPISRVYNWLVQLGLLGTNLVQVGPANPVPPYSARGTPESKGPSALKILRR